MATHFGILAWKIPWTEDGLQSTELQKVGHHWVTEHTVQAKENDVMTEACYLPDKNYMVDLCALLSVIPLERSCGQSGPEPWETWWSRLQSPQVQCVWVGVCFSDHRQLHQMTSLSGWNSSLGISVIVFGADSKSAWAAKSGDALPAPA